MPPEEPWALEWRRRERGHAPLRRAVGVATRNTVGPPRQWRARGVTVHAPPRAAEKLTGHLVQVAFTNGNVEYIIPCMYVVK